MTLHDQRIKESPIFFNSIEGLQAVIGRVAVDYDLPPIPVAVVSGNFAQREISQQFNGQIKYPFCALTLSSMSENMTGYNNNLLRSGVSTTQNDKVYTYRLMPVTAVFRVRFYTQDNAELLSFSRRWLLRKKDMQFKLANDSFNVNIKVEPSKDLNVPELEFTEYGNIYVLETSCEVSTYIGNIETSTKITQINLNTNLTNNIESTVLEKFTRIIKLSDLEKEV